MKEYKERVVQCKVSENTYRRLEAVREKYGFRSIYEVMQTLLTLYLRYISTPIEMGGAEMDELQAMFGEFGKKRGRTNITGTGGEDKMKLVSCVSVLRHEDTGGRMMRTSTAVSDGRMVSDYSTDVAVRTVLRAASKELYERITDIGAMTEDKRVLHVLATLVEDYERRYYMQAVHEEFEDDGNIPTGEALVREH
jgi:hypothetical protein